MIGTRAVPLILLCVVVAISNYATAGSNYLIRQDPQAVAIAQAAITAMGGAQAIAGYQDSVASGTVTVAANGNPVSYPITMKSKGLRETRVELLMTKGTNVRIVNQGQGAIIRPDGSVKNLYSNNTFHEHVNHVPLLSVLAEYASGNVNLLYKGVAEVQGQSEDVIEVDFLPDLSAANGPTFASMSRTLFFVNQTTKLVDKTQRVTFYSAAANAWTSDNALGAGRQEQTSETGKMGAAVGDFAATATGMTEFLGGGSEALVTSPAAATGVGVVVPAVGVGIAIHGGATTATAFSNLFKSSEPTPATEPYKRPSGATTPEQRESVQGKPCVDCGKTESKMNANHKTPLVEEHYKTGTINKTNMRSTDAVNSHCPTCSASQGGKLSQYSKQMKKKIKKP